MAVAIDRFAVAMAEDLLACLCEQLAATVGGEVCRCCLSPGPAPADFCCDCGQGHGQAWVRVVRIFPASTNFPAQAASIQQCALNSVGVELEMGAWRCAHLPDDQGNPPTCAQVTTDTEVLLDDAAAMRAAVRCCFAPGRDYVPGEWTPRGPSGGCMGGAMTVTVQAYDCCPEETP